MNASHFQGALHIFAGYVEQHRPKECLINTIGFLAYVNLPMEKIMPWRNEHISPLYSAAEVKKFASPHPPATPKPEKHGAGLPDEDRPTCHFDSKDEATAWLS